MPVTSNKYIIQNMERLSFFDLSDGACLFTAEDIQESTWTNEQEDVYATGKNGVRIGSASRNKAARISITNGAILDGALAVQVGSDIVTETVTVPQMEILTVAAGKATISYKAQGEAGSEIPFIYLRNSDGTLGQRFSVDATAGADKFSFAVATGAITVPTGGAVPDGSQIVVWYNVSVENAKHVENLDTKFSREGKLVAEAWAKGICDGKDYYGVVIFGRCKASGNFEMTFGSDPSVQSMEFEALSNTCSGSGSVLWDFYVYDGEDIETVD